VAAIHKSKEPRASIITVHVNFRVHMNAKKESVDTVIASDEYKLIKKATTEAQHWTWEMHQ